MVTKKMCPGRECNRPTRVGGFCDKHYRRWRKYGTPEMPARPSTEEKFWARVNKTDHCWNWTGPINAWGYGSFTINRRIRAAHRVAHELFTGPIPEGREIDHLCHSRACVNPEHLRVVTRKQNMENQAGAHRGSVSGVRGVRWSTRSRKWRVVVVHNKKYYGGGFFSNLADAESAAIAKRNELFTHNDMDRTGRTKRMLVPVARDSIQK